MSSVIGHMGEIKDTGERERPFDNMRSHHGEMG